VRIRRDRCGLFAAAIAGAALCASGSAGAATHTTDRPSKATCKALRPSRWQPARGVANAHGSLRVIGIQYKQDVRNVRSYSTFRTAMRCLVEDFVVPNEKPGEPTLVVFNEDIGLMTLGVGVRGAAVRALATGPDRAPLGDTGPAPVAAAQALGAVNAAYAPQIAAYQAMFGPIDPRKAVFVGATDTFVRAFSKTFSSIARDYGVYVVAANNQPRYRETHNPALVKLFGDPSIKHLTTAYVATTQHVANTAFLWGPHNVHPKAPVGERNLLFRNEKVPLTDIERTLLHLDSGPTRGPAALRNARGYHLAGLHLGFATSLPAFTYGYPFGKRPAGFKPCANLAKTYAACMDHLGVDTMIQAEANPGRWANDGTPWQPTDWLGSAWRAVTDPTLHFRYAVNPFMVGNLLDLAFDGQSAITARHGSTPRRDYVGNPWRLRHFLVLAPWVRRTGPRAALVAEGARLAPGSDDPQENDYLETAVYADLVPAKERR
jgi:hypothetical protein